MTCGFIWRCGRWRVFAVLQTDREDVLSHCGYSRELPGTVSLRGGSVCHRATEGTHSNERAHKHNDCLLSSMRKMVLWFGDSEVIMSYKVNTLPHPNQSVIYCDFLQLWVTHTHTHICCRGSRSSANPLIFQFAWHLLNLSDGDADCSKAGMGNISISQIVDVPNRSRITVTPRAEVKLEAGCSLNTVSHVWLVSTTPVCCQTVFNMSPAWFSSFQPSRTLRGRYNGSIQAVWQMGRQREEDCSSI